MTTTTPSTALATIQPAFADPERLAFAGFLAGYLGLTREAYALDLRQFTTWCRTRSLPLFGVRRAGIESFARELEARGRARATVIRRLCTVAGFYKYAVEEELLDNSPAAHVRRPRLDYEPYAVAPGPQRARRAPGRRWARPTSRARADLAARAERALRTARAIDLAIGERTERRVFLARDGGRLDRHSAGRIVRKTARSAGITKLVTPHTLRHAFITAALDAGVPLRDVQEAASHADPRTTMRYDRARGSLDRHATYIVAALPRRRRPIAAKLGNSAAW
jgi:integrase/recombinase XerD